MSRTGRQILLARRPQGMPGPADFRLVEVAVPDPGPGEVLIRNSIMSVDPYMRGRMNAGASYIEPFEVGEAMDGGAVGTVVVSASASFDEGDVVVHSLGWRDYAVAPERRVRKVDTSVAPASASLGVLGIPGFTAYVGLLEIAALRAGDIVFVSGAAGAVGSLACQIAKLRGHRVIGSAGSAEKVAYLTDELGLDAAFDYHAGPVADLLASVAPEGIDVYFDNVGGDHLEAAIGLLRRFGRVASCGAVSQYNATTPPPGPRNLTRLFSERLTLRGFIVTDHMGLHADFLRDVGGWVGEGRLTCRETFVDGLEHAPEALIGLFRGTNVGKMLVRIA